MQTIFDIKQKVIAMRKNIIIIGAGYAGILTAKKLAKKLKKNPDINITIIDKNPFHTMLTELHEVAANRVEEDSIKLSLKKVFAGRRVEVILDTVSNIDFLQKTVIGKQRSYTYDFLVIAAGSRPTYFGNKGAEQFAFKLWSYDDAIILRDHIQNCFRKAVRETDIGEKKKLLNFYVVGAGFTGTEMVGELAEYVPFLCDEFEIERSMVKIHCVDMLPRVVPALTEKLSEKIERRLVKMGVELCLKTGVVNIGEDSIEIKCDETLKQDKTGTVIWAAGIESSQITAEAAAILPSSKRNRLDTDKYLRSCGDHSVFVVGDNIGYTLPGEKNPVPQLVENCEQSSGTAAHNIICALNGSEDMEEYKPKFHGVMVSVGGRYGVAKVGTEKHKISLPSFFAMFVKHFINIIYFIQILGWNKIFSYLKHEFFTVRHNRSFVGGYFSNKTPSFLLVPLRLWLGTVWLFEGIIKISEGWFSAPMLTDFFGGANKYYNSIINSSAGSAATAEVVSSATKTAPAAAEKVGQVFLNFDFLGLFKVIFVSGKALAKSTVNDFAFRIDMPLMNWFIEKLILPVSSVQVMMQIFIVIAEILIGLSLIGGLLTTPSSALSLVLQFMFVTTTGLYLGTFWMIFAAAALLIGSGRIFGLDYYVMPYLKKQWRKLPFVRKLYIYND
jgi:NADH dehydrogenase